MLVLFIGVIVDANHSAAQDSSLLGMHHPGKVGHNQTQAPSSADEERCRVPDFAKAMGHETIWKQHNGCL